MNALLDWDRIPEQEYENYKKRIAIVELLLDDGIDPLTKKGLRDQFRMDNRIGERTLHNWLARYRQEGPAGLMFCHRPRPHSPRIIDEQLRERVLDLVRELPSRSVAKLRRLLKGESGMAEKIGQLSDRSIYRFLQENGFSHIQRQAMLVEVAGKAFQSFEASYSLDIVQGDARDGIWLDLPDGRKVKTYLFLWVDDHSRKILFGKYYLDEKLPRMEDSFKYMVLRYGIPRVIYLDNGKVYVSRQFSSVLAELRIKQIHHKPYQAWAKGKVEAVQKTIKNDFQSEAAQAGMRSLEELNSAFWAWAEMDYNMRLHSSTGQAPEERFYKGLRADRRRVEDLAAFQAMFLWKQKRTVSKWGKVSVHANHYPVQTRPPKSVLEVRYDPLDLSEVLIYDPLTRTLLEKSTVGKQVNRHAPNLPQESGNSSRKISASSVAYFSRLREKHMEAQKGAQDISFQKLQDKAKENLHE